MTGREANNKLRLSVETHALYREITLMRVWPPLLVLVVLAVVVVGCGGEPAEAPEPRACSYSNGA